MKKIRKVATGEGDDYTIGCFLDYSYFKENCEMIAIDLSKQFKQEQLKKLILLQI